MRLKDQRPLLLGKNTGRDAPPANPTTLRDVPRGQDVQIADVKQPSRFRDQLGCIAHLNACLLTEKCWQIFAHPNFGGLAAGRGFGLAPRSLCVWS